MEKQIELIKNLIALSKSTDSEAESENAANTVRLLMKKHGITEADLQETKSEKFRFFYQKDYEKKLIVQVCAKVLDSSKFDIHVNRDGRTKPFFAIEMTHYEFVQAMSMIDFYKPIMAKEMARAASAFCLAQDLTATPIVVQNFTERDLEMAKLTDSFKKHEYIKALNE
jgi:hypothetical protein